MLRLLVAAEGDRSVNSAVRPREAAIREESRQGNAMHSFHDASIGVRALLRTHGQCSTRRILAAIPISLLWLIVRSPPVFAGSLTWSAAAPLPLPKAGMGLGVIDGTLYAVGGYNNAPLSSVLAYDAAKNLWTPRAPMPTPRNWESDGGVAVVNKILYAIGGGGGGYCHAEVEAYDPSKDAWTEKASMPTPRCDLAVVAVKGLIYAIGGGDTASSTAYRYVEVYDPSTDSWKAAASMPTGRTRLSAGVVNGIIYAIGGHVFSSVSTVAVVEAYDPATNTWSTRAPMPTPRAQVGLATLNGLLYAVAGISLNADGASSLLSTVEVYDPHRDTWTRQTSLPIPLRPGEAKEVNGAIHVVGGYNGQWLASHYVGHVRRPAAKAPHAHPDE